MHTKYYPVSGLKIQTGAAHTCPNYLANTDLSCPIEHTGALHNVSLHYLKKASSLLDLHTECSTATLSPLHQHQVRFGLPNKEWSSLVYIAFDPKCLSYAEIMQCTCLVLIPFGRTCIGKIPSGLRPENLLVSEKSFGCLNEAVSWILRAWSTGSLNQASNTKYSQWKEFSHLRLAIPGICTLPQQVLHGQTTINCAVAIWIGIARQFYI